MSSWIEFPIVQKKYKHIEEFIITSIMLCATSYIFYTMRDIKYRFVNLAMKDPLTGALNRNGIQNFIDYELKKFFRNETPFCIMILDIDYFKKINDTHGHNTGDDVIATTSATLKNNLREVDSVARWGGEEFLVLLPETGIKTASKIAESLRKKVEELEFLSSEKKSFKATISIGVTEATKSDENFDKLLNRADQKLYIAKESGRNQVCSKMA